MKTILAVLAALMFAPLNTPLWGEQQVVTIQATASDGFLEAGKQSTLIIELRINKPFHINSDSPLQDFLIPTTVELEPNPDVAFGKVIYPKAILKTLPVFDSPMALFEGTVNITAGIIPAANLTAKEITIRGRVRSQACNDKICLPPVWQSFSLTLPVEIPRQKPDAVSTFLTEAPVKEPPKPIEEPEKSTTVDFDREGLFITFLLVFLGGLALNLTPCVYPMIPITISYFGGQAQGKKGSIIIHSLLYVIGMAITYSILGVAAAMTGGLFGAALQYPPVLVGIALIMVLLALSMFDVYELRMPAFLNRLAGHSQKGFGGTILMGLTVGIVAAPCIGPFVLGLLTYVGNKGNIILGFSLFFVLALGLGIPFLLLGIFSGSIHHLPRSGAWMVWVRKIFGFILLAMAVYFLENLMPNPLTYYLALALIMLLAGIYMAWIEPTPATGKVFPFVRNIVGILFFAGALYAAVSGIQTSTGLSGAQSMHQSSDGSIRWSAYSDEILERASREDKPVFIDFYADWCAPCKELDANTFSAPEVIERSREFNMLKVDLTTADDPQAERLRQKYQVRGVPTLVFLRPDGREISDLRVTGFEPKEVFLDKMNRALHISAN